jgi:hypothetical protein
MPTLINLFKGEKESNASPVLNEDLLETLNFSIQLLIEVLD